MNTTDIPVLRATEIIKNNKSVQLKVWCKHCKSYHYHGLDEGHRIAHCFNDNSPYRTTGYFIFK